MRPAVPPFFSPEGERSRRCNGRYPDGARAVASPRRLGAEFGPSCAAGLAPSPARS